MEAERGVRPMSAHDIDQVTVLEKLSFGEPWSERLLSEGLDSRLDTYFVFAQGDQILGYAVIRILADEGEIQRIAVLPGHRGGGIGRRLMEAMLSFARSRSVASIALEVRAGNEAARHLYASYGFAPEAVRRGYYRNPPEDAVIMWNRDLLGDHETITT